MANSRGRRRRFGAIRRLPSGRYQARYPGPDGVMRPAPFTFETTADADDWLAERQTEIRRGDWRDPDAGAVGFRAYAEKWVEERELAPLTQDLYRYLLDKHLFALADLDLDEITAPRVREWRAERLRLTGAKTITAKAYRLLKAIMETAVDDELITRNPCRIKGAGKEKAAERRIATVAQVDALANAVGMRWRLMVYLGAYGPLRPEELAGLRRRDIDLDNLRLRVRLAEPERMDGRRVQGDTKSEAGTRTVILPAFLHRELRWHLESYAEPGPDGLIFVGEKGAPFRRSTFGRKWRKAREVVGLPEGFRFYDLRHTGHTLSTRSGATLKDTMVRAGQSSEKAALIYQHSDEERQEEVAAGLDATVQKAREEAAQKAVEKRSGTNLARDD
ncbi:MULTISPECIES: site-specific integrase [Streptomyces]|uniref:Site-specific integrase n=1 Tax=Streptomyces koelreuteriae TaxID=2838015 RepID=A0ABX8FSZ5_9ACTN|nr:MULTISPECIES: site-specific integrase [Streptomyces]QWB24213.1 site-specific integrase [Streptomyces koelreuteriae]UUA07209.1 site-specific integrase [Streptomyces koelreuteriae]UUA14838.1 site-specific integrase [Streptomyces sp. CRCS-T-1]